MTVRFPRTVIVALATLCFSSWMRVQEGTKANIKLLTLLGTPLQVTVAERHGLFAKFGIVVETENSASSDELRTKLGAGKGELAYLAVDNAVAMVELAHQDVVIVMGGEGSQNELMAQEEIKSIQDLRGKTLLVDAPNTAYALQMKKILLQSGLEPDKDYEMKAYGATPLRLRAMRENKSFSASMLGPPSSIVAKHGGFVSLGSVAELLGPYQAAGFFGRRRWMKEHSEELISFLAAIIAAQRWLMAPENRMQVVELMSKQMQLAPEVAAESYVALMTRPGGFEKDAQFDVAGFQTVLQLRAELEGFPGGHTPPPEKYYNPAYYQAALAKSMTLAPAQEKP